MKIGVVTVLYNSETVLDDFFLGLNNQEYKNIILYIIDNNSTDNSYKMSVDYKKKSSYEVKIIKNMNNIGVAAANNQGIKMALKDKCDYILLSNNDITLKKDSISKLVEIAKTKDKKLVIPKIYFYNTNKIWCAGGNFSNFKGTATHIGELEIDSKKYDENYECEYSPTCFILIEKSIFDIVGLMDEKYFVYFDDTDFMYRVNKKGYKIFYTGKTSIEHKVSTTTGGSESLFSIFYGTRNRIYYINKNLNLKHKIISILFFYMTRIIKYLKYDISQKESLLKGIKEGQKMLKELKIK